MCIGPAPRVRLAQAQPEHTATHQVRGMAPGDIPPHGSGRRRLPGNARQPSDVPELPRKGKEAGTNDTISPPHAKPCRISQTTRQEIMSMPEKDNAPLGVRGLHGRAWGLRWMREAIEERP